MTAIVGSAEHYAQFVALARARIAALGITYETIDKICGFSERYTAALMAGKKAMSVYSFFTFAQALGLNVYFHHDAEGLARLQHRSQWIQRRIPGRKTKIVYFYRDTDFYRRIGQLSGKARLQKIDAERRSALARNAALARWARNAAFSRWQREKERKLHGK